MLLDGYWKDDLNFIIRQLEKWSGKRSWLFNNYAEHEVNQGLLYSAVIIRKIVEDEKDAKSYFDSNHTTEQHLKMLFYDVPITKYDYVGTNNFFINSKVFISDYDTKNAEIISMPLSQVCNQLIHSYVWSVVYTNTGKQIYGVFISSDKFKERELYFLKIDDWINAIRFVISNSKV